MSAIPRRDLHFDFSAVERDWYAQDIYTSTFFDAFSVLLPEGERFFVESVKHFKDRVDDPVLADEIVGFVGQEAIHGRAHRAFNAMLVAQGFDRVPRYERRLRRLLDLGRRTLSKESQLAITVALEHITALLAEQLLTLPEHQDSAGGEVQRLWMWHALEETEHKHVAFDLLAKVDGSYARRVAMMLLSSFFLVLVMTRFHVGLLARAGALFDLSALRTGLVRLWIRPGLLRRLLRPYGAYFARDFHPKRHADPTPLVDRWRPRIADDGA